MVNNDTDPLRPSGRQTGFTQDAQGRWFAYDRNGQKIYSPTTANRPEDTFLKTGDFNTSTGEWDQKTNWNNLIAMGTLGAIAAPAALAGAGAIGGGAAASAAPAAAGGPVGGIPLAYGAGATATNAGALGAGVGGSAAGGSALGFLGNNWQDIAGAAGNVMGGISRTQASNRQDEFGGQGLLAALQGTADRDFSQQTIAREQEGRAGRSSAWKDLLSAQHTLSPGARPQLAGQYNVAPRQATGAERTGADAMSQEVMARLQGGNPIAPVTRRDPLASIDPKLLKAGKLESILGYASPLLTYLGR